MNLLRIASHVASMNIEAARKKKPKTSVKSKKPKSKREKEILHQDPEFACRVEIDLVADFEGEGSKAALLKKLKSEITASLTSAMQITARDLKLELKNITVRPVSLDCAVTEGTSEDEEL